MSYENGLYTLNCSETDYLDEYVAIINGVVHQDSDPLQVPVDILLANLSDVTLKKVA